jgi:hypothetical protein
MKKTLLSAVLASVLLLGAALAATGSMSSESYQIQTSVLSGGGGPMSSDNFSLNGTIGQPTPLMDPAPPPNSDSYTLYPGYWYTLDLILYECLGDLDGDGDVDGLDLADVVAGFGTGFPAEDLVFFAEEFGSMDCP